MYQKGGHQCEDRGRDCSSAAASQQMPRTAGNHQKVGREKEKIFPRAFRENMALLVPWVFAVIKLR